MTIRARLLLFTIVLILGAMAAAGMIGYRMGSSSLETSYSERLTQVRIAKSQALQNDFENIGKSLLITSEMNKTREALRAFQQDVVQVAERANKEGKAAEWRDQLIRGYGAADDSDIARAISHLQKLPLYLQSRFMKQARTEDVPAKSIVTLDNPEGSAYFKLHESVHPFFLDYADRFDIQDILLVDNTGTVVYTLQKAMNFGTNLNTGLFSSTSLGEAYRWSMAAAPRSFKFFDFSAQTGITPPAGIFVTPIFDRSQLLGAVIFQISLDRIDAVLSDNHQWKKLGLKDTGEVLAIGPDGLFRNNSRAFFENPAAFLKAYEKTGASKQLVQSLEQAHTSALKLGIAQDKARHYFHSEEMVESDHDYLGNDSLDSIGKVHLPGGADWLIMAKINHEEAVAPLSQYLVLFGLGAFVLLATFILLFLVLSKRLTTPLRSLETAMDKLKHHDWKERLPYSANDEYAKVFEDYNQLADTLKEATESRQILENLVEALKEPLFLIEVSQNESSSQRWVIRKSNNAASTMIGIPNSSLNDSDLKLWLEANFDQISAELQSEKGGVDNLESVLKRISGEKVPVSLSFNKLTPKSADILSFVLIATDISRQKQIERELKIQENLLKDSEAMSATGSFRWEMSSGVTAWSDQLFEILGYDQKTAKPSFDIFRALVLQEDLPLLDTAFREAQKNLKPLNLDLRLRRADTHELIWVRMIGKIDYDQYGNPKSTSGIIQDVTDLKRTETALIYAKDEALKSSQAKSEFLAHMSHEIRTPMNAIMGMAELLRETKLDEDQQYYISIFCKAGEVLMTLINDILDLSKIEAGEVSVENIPFDLRKVMNDIQDMMRPRALEKGVDYSFEIAKNINPHLMGDPTKLRQVLINLVSNSIKFTERGQIRVNVIKNPTKKDYLMISVSDSGVGIPTTKQHLIFQKFSQADSSITRRYGGTGLGLAISKSLVELMGGQIWFKSREAVGTTFFISVPQREQVYNVATMKPVPMKTPELEFIQKKTPRDPNRKVRILLADDTEDNRILFTHYLKNGPYEIVEAENGLEALDKIKSDEFDIVFMDVQMPEMDGYAATEKVREWEHEVHHAHIPIIALTAHALSDDREKSIRAGCDDHITKPFKRETLMKVMDHYLH